jgi:hypothetical protein
MWPEVFDTVWFKGLLYKLTVLNFPSHILISRLLNVPNVPPVNHIHVSWHAGWGGPEWTRLPCTVQSRPTTYLLTPSRHVELVQCADDTALVVTSRSPLLVGYLEAYLGRLQHWLRDWRIAINVSKSTALLFVEAARSTQKARPDQILGEPTQWVETARYLWVTLDTQLTQSAHVN